MQSALKPLWPQCDRAARTAAWNQPVFHATWHENQVVKTLAQGLDLCFAANPLKWRGKFWFFFDLH